MGVKTRPYKIRRLTNKDTDFYAVVGPLLSRREIVKELGNPVWDDDGKIWFVAIPRGEQEAIACAALHNKTLCSLWVSPEARQNTVGTTLVLRILGEADGQISVTATEQSRGLLTECGFVERGKRGRYITMTTGDDA